jgi:class 3 adenylate cyclase
VLPAITAPTLIMSNRGDRDAHPEEGRYIASQIPNSKYVEFDGEDHLVWTSNQNRILGEIEAFLTGRRSDQVIDRILTTILVTDIVGSTEIAAKVGDSRWSQLLQKHHSVVRDHLGRYRGREINTAGDSFLAAFDGPARAVRCAQAIASDVRHLGLSVPCGLHTGECQLEAATLSGIALHIASRIAAIAAPGEVLVSSTVRDLVAGSEISFVERGLQALRGVPGQWNILAVEAV